MVLGAKEILDEAKQPGDFLWELVPLWSGAQPETLPGNNFAAGETTGTVFMKKPSPLLRHPLSCSETANRQLIWQDMEAFTVS